MPYKLGKLSPKYNPKTLRFSAYLKTPVLPAPPAKAYWEYKIPPATIGMFLNDQIGDCTCAAVAHHIMLMTAHTGSVVVPTDAEVLAMYSAISGYDPKTGANDNGCAITDVLEYWQNTGLAGHKIDGWASIDPTNAMYRKLGVYLFAAANVGVQLPASAQDQFSAGETWTPTGDLSIEGGHDILESGYGKDGDNYETWGKGDQKATNDWSAQFVDESYVVLSKDWVDMASDIAPNAMNYGQLQADLAAIKA